VIHDAKMSAQLAAGTKPALDNVSRRGILGGAGALGSDFEGREPVRSAIFVGPPGVG
jgi:hypothetical protein